MIKSAKKRREITLVQYTCEAGQFTCSICGTVYRYSDLKDICEGQAWFLREPEEELVLDHLGAKVGEKILQTVYFGDDYAKPPLKAGLVLLWEWVEVREKRIIPTNLPFEAVWQGKSYRHLAEYSIDPRDNVTQSRGDYWEENASGGILEIPIGPSHFWSQHLVDVVIRQKHPELVPKNWEDFVFNMCRGERNLDKLKELKEEGYPV